MSGTSLPYAPHRVLNVVELLWGARLSGAIAEDVVLASTQAAQMGLQAASQCSSCEPEEELSLLGVEVCHLARDEYVGLLAYTSYDASRRGCVVSVYDAAVGRKRKLLHEAGVNLDSERIERVVLAHELFHVLEFTHDERAVDRVCPIRTKGLLGTTRPRVPRRAGEVAAHAFARSLTGEVLHPTLMDAIALLADGAITRSELNDRIISAWQMVEAFEGRAI